VPRIAADRSRAAPVSRGQVARRQRILAAAAELGASADFDRVQMLEVASDAEVAIGTLYRYFPSKTHLFAAVFAAEITRCTERDWPRGGADPVADVAEGLVMLTRRLLQRPQLCAAMVRASAASFAAKGTAEAELAEAALFQAILGTIGGGAAPGVVRLLVYGWWGVLVSCLRLTTSAAQAEAELRLATQLILGTSQ
jgi:TetR/AcrR family transcriptional regulator, cholesterol catabolism regulator